MSTLRVPRHALLRDKLARLRSSNTDAATFRRLLAEAGLIMASEILRDLPESRRVVDTPLARVQAMALEGPEPCLVAVLRAGLGMLDGARLLLPDAPVGHIGLVRDPGTLQPREYLCSLPGDLGRRGALMLDPVLATGGSAIAAINRVKQAGATAIRFACLVASPEGAARLAQAHPDVPVLAAALDERLDQKGHVIPGLGAAGDRAFGTEETS